MIRDEYIVSTLGFMYAPQLLILETKMTDDEKASFNYNPLTTNIQILVLNSQETDRHSHHGKLETQLKVPEGQ